MKPTPSHIFTKLSVLQFKVQSTKAHGQTTKGFMLTIGFSMTSLGPRLLELHQTEVVPKLALILQALLRKPADVPLQALRVDREHRLPRH